MAAGTVRSSLQDLAMKTRHVPMFAFFIAASIGMLTSPARAEARSVVQPDEQVQRLLIAQRHAPINSQVRLQEHLQALSSDSPLHALSIPARQRFVASLRFNDSGITSLRYQDVVEELSYSEAYRLLALFGAERTLGKMPLLRIETSEDERILGSLRAAVEDDHLGYACTGRATCSMSSQEICMTGC